jgi:hypothetical protein
VPLISAADAEANNSTGKHSQSNPIKTKPTKQRHKTDKNVYGSKKVTIEDVYNPDNKKVSQFS